MLDSGPRSVSHMPIEFWLRPPAKRRAWQVKAGLVGLALLVITLAAYLYGVLSPIL
jgi:hypothetical protein